PGVPVVGRAQSRRSGAPAPATRRALCPCTGRVRPALELLAGQTDLAATHSPGPLQESQALDLLWRAGPGATHRRSRRECVDGFRHRAARYSPLPVRRRTAVGDRHRSGAAESAQAVEAHRHGSATNAETLANLERCAVAAGDRRWRVEQYR